MSDTDSFIEEVTEEVRRDKLYKTMRRYGWIPILIVVLIVGGAAWREYAKAQDAAQAQAFGDAILAGLQAEDDAARAAALDAVAAPGPGGAAILQMLVAAEEAQAENPAEAVARLQAIADNPEIPGIYRQIAQYKALSRSDGGLSVEARRAGLESLAIAGQPLRLLAEEQLGLIDVETGEIDAAIARFTAIVEDAEATAGLRSRASQLIVALGGTLERG
ncbi:hypothetical protein [Cognatishimia sp. F0-27]|uniref:hypothetical protein n=1 Tax=Cognatishimia sp. F0-27 TaxID=2816855 RepID=UPI001D0C2F6E|nr:hypothetical protein [Cognatishimia sp. F0-27]